jgi:hypothetical protein
MKIIGVSLLVIAAIVYAELHQKFGTIEPCGILRAAVREHTAQNGAANLSDDAIDAMIEPQFGPLSRQRCMSLALQAVLSQQPKQQQPPQPAAQPLQPAALPQVQTPSYR